MKKYKLFILSILFIGNIFAQKTPMCSIDVKVSDRLTEKKEAGAVVAVFDGTVQIATQIANNKGGVVLEVPTGKNYKVVISKAGKVTRFFYVDLKNVNAETLPPGDKVGFAHRWRITIRTNPTIHRLAPDP